MIRRLRNLHEESGQRVRIIGHSLGGMLARSLVQQAPEHIDRIISLGSPFRDLVKAHPAVVGLWDKLKLVRGPLVGRNLKPSCATGHCLCHFVRDMLDPEPRDVPQYAIYSRKDGVAHWESCMSEDPEMNTEIDCTHIGMAFHAGVYRIIAERLQQLR